MTVSSIAALEIGDPDEVPRIGDPTVLWLTGEYDLATVSHLADTLAIAICADRAGLIVDLSGVTFIGAATIPVLSRGRDILQAQSRTFTLRSPSRSARRVLDLCGMADLVLDAE
jgi:anti-anti-sigma factor